MGAGVKRRAPATSCQRAVMDRRGPSRETETVKLSKRRTNKNARIL